MKEALQSANIKRLMLLSMSYSIRSMFEYSCSSCTLVSELLINIGQLELDLTRRVHLGPHLQLQQVYVAPRAKQKKDLPSAGFLRKAARLVCSLRRTLAQSWKTI